MRAPPILLRRVQRFFSSFPGSWPGAGLLLLRVVAGGAAALRGGAYLFDLGDESFVAWALGLVTIAGGVGLVAGFLTPGAGACAGLGTLVIVWSASPPLAGRLSIDAVAAFFVLADASALVLLGPGALSMDARLFGRREIVIPQVSREGR